MRTLDEIRDDIGQLSVDAMAYRILDEVELALGVALRHSGRIARGELEFTPAVADDMEASIERAREVFR